ncbi:MAG: AtpZ/AtpI family protein [Geminicoccaceae bacterium]
MAEDPKQPSFEEFDARLAKLRQPEQKTDGQGDTPPDRTSFGEGIQAGIEVIAGVGFGLLIGYGLDRWLGTRPLFLIVFFLLGAAAGMLNAYRYLRRLQARQGP